MEKNEIHTLSLVGYGNVATHLGRQLKTSGISITHLLGKSTKDAHALAEELNALLVFKADALPRHQLALLCVPDDQINALSGQIDPETPIAYTSGAVEMESLPTRDKLGVFYPLQSFSKKRSIDLHTVPFFIESNHALFEEQLLMLAKKISSNVHLANSQDRKHLHVSAVWVNNFTNHLLHIAQRYAEENGQNFEHLKPLLKETIAKLDELSPREAQTGPARRGDVSVIQKHLELLTGTDRDIYALITSSIIDTYSKKP